MWLRSGQAEDEGGRKDRVEVEDRAPFIVKAGVTERKRDGRRSVGTQAKIGFVKVLDAGERIHDDSEAEGGRLRARPFDEDAATAGREGVSVQAQGLVGRADRNPGSTHLQTVAEQPTGTGGNQPLAP